LRKKFWQGGSLQYYQTPPKRSSACLPLRLCYRLVAFSGKVKYVGNFSPKIFINTLMIKGIY